MEAAGTTRSAFDRHFTDLEDCFTAYTSETLELFLVAVGAALQQVSGWREQIRATAYAIVRFFQEDERRTQMTLIEILSAGPRAQLVRDGGIDMMVTLIDQGRAEMADPDLLSRATAEAIAGAVFSRMRLIFEQGETALSHEHVPELMYTVVLPYVGAEAALEELEIPPPGEG